MTLGSHEQQRMLLADCADGPLTREEIREMLLSAKPSVAIAVFLTEQYAGTFTSDLFSDEATTYFDDIDQFLSLQRIAVEGLAAKYQESAAWVDVLNVYSVPWWQYRDAAADEPSGVVINLSPSGPVEIREGLVRQELAATLPARSADTPAAPRERPAYSAALLRYAALHKSIAVQAALLGNTRKAREVAAVLLVQGFRPFGSVCLEVHTCLPEMGDQNCPPTGYEAVEKRATKFAEKLGHQPSNGGSETSAWRWQMLPHRDPLVIYAQVKEMSDKELDGLMRLLVVLRFGQEPIDQLETEPSLFSEVARDLGVNMRAYWTPDQEFLSHLRREQLETVVRESGAAWHLGNLSRYTKAKLVEALARYFERTADQSAELTESEQKGFAWLPKCMRFGERAAIDLT